MINDVMIKMIEYFNEDVRRINHAIKVYSFAETISEKTGLSEREKKIVKLAAILHDIGIKEAERKYDSSGGKYQELEGPPIAKEILNKLNISEDIIERVCYLIGNHHSYSKIDGIDFRILIEADFIVNIFEDNIGAEEIKIIKEKYFRTDAGKELIHSMYKD